MKHILLTLLLAFLPVVGRGQDIVTLLDDAPLVSGVLTRILETPPSYKAKVVLTVADPAESQPSKATGNVAVASCGMRWDLRLADIKSAQVSDAAKRLITQINGERLSLLIRFDEKSNCLLLKGAHAYLQQPFTIPKFSSPKRGPKPDMIGTQRCYPEMRRFVQSDGKAIEVTVWRSKDLKGLPLRIAIRSPLRQYDFQFFEPRLSPVPVEQFQIPDGLTRYDTVEDLLQSVLLEKMKRRLGLGK